MAKRGPNTEKGKVSVRHNALTHGLRSQSPVIPHLETEAEWQTHLAGMSKSLAPEGSLETFYAQSIALCAWLIMRCNRYETFLLGDGQERVEEDVAHALGFGIGSTDGALVILTRSRRFLELLGQIRDSHDDIGLGPDDMAVLADGIEEALLALGHQSPFEIKGVKSVILTRRPMTGKLMLDSVMDFLTRQQFGWDSPLPYLFEFAVERLEHFERAYERLPIEITRLRQERAMLEDQQLAKIMRYEAHHRRRFFQYSHEFEAMQRKRLGKSAPLIRVDVQGMPDETPHE